MFKMPNLIYWYTYANWRNLSDALVKFTNGLLNNARFRIYYVMQIYADWGKHIRCLLVSTSVITVITMQLLSEWGCCLFHCSGVVR